MKKGFSFIITLVIVATSLSSCKSSFLPEREEIEDLMMIRVIGLDKSIKDPKQICVTLLSKKNGGGSESKEGGQGAGGGKGGGSSQQSVIFSNEASTFLQSEREFQTYTDKRIFWGHVDYYLVGEVAARDGIQRYIDFISRDHDMRGTSKVYIIKDSTAKNFIEEVSTGDYFLPDRLKAVGRNSELMSGSQELELVEFLNWLNKKYSCAIAPVMRLKTNDNVKKEGKQPSKDMEIAGYAVFKNFKLVSYLDREQTLGENFLLNRIIAGYLNVKDPSGALVGLDIVSNQTKIKPVFSGDKLQKMDVNVRISSNINEVQSKTSIFNETTIKYLETKQAEEVKKTIEDVISFAQKNNTDFVDMSTQTSVNKPAKWDKIKYEWYKIFPTLPISIKVESRINRTYDLREPSGTLEDEHK